MEIKKGVFSPNRTYGYLFPALLIKNKDIYAHCLTVGPGFLLGVFIADENFARIHLIEGKNPIFLAVDTSVRPYLSDSIMSFFKRSENYILDYPYNNSPYIRIFIFDIDKSIRDSFLKGEYSKMYSEDFLETMPDNGSKGIFNRTEKGKKDYIRFIKDRFGVSLSENDETLKTIEYDLPYDYEEGSKAQEILNYEYSKEIREHL